MEQRRARQSFFSEIIHKNNIYNTNNAHSLFNVLDRLTNPSASVHSEVLFTKSCNDFASFFTDEILKIRQTVYNFILSKKPVTPAFT